MTTMRTFLILLCFSAHTLALASPKREPPPAAKARQNPQKRQVLVYLMTTGPVTLQVDFFARHAPSPPPMRWRLGPVPPGLPLPAHQRNLRPYKAKLPPGRWVVRVIWWLQRHKGFVKRGLLHVPAGSAPARLQLFLSPQGVLNWQQVLPAHKGVQLQHTSPPLHKLGTKTLIFRLTNGITKPLYGTGWGANFFGRLERWDGYWKAYHRGPGCGTTAFGETLYHKQSTSAFVGYYTSTPKPLNRGKYRFLLTYALRPWPQTRPVRARPWPFPAPKVPLRVPSKQKAATSNPSTRPTKTNTTNPNSTHKKAKPSSPRVKKAGNPHPNDKKAQKKKAQRSAPLLSPTRLYSLPTYYGLSIVFRIP